MSYTRRYHETVSRTVTVSYPASQNGGSTSATVTIPVEVNIHVDTMPFDQSVQHCENNVNLLTTSIVATEAAEIVSKEVNSRKVAKSIVNGFFSYIRSEISQQIAELSQNIDAHLMHLHELAKSCADKKRQMETDYHRITSRYFKIFDDLNNELSNRIHDLDKPTFSFKKESDNQRIRSIENDMVNVVTVCGTESSGLQSKISASIAKKRALDAINKAKLFLLQQKQINQTIQQSMINESTSNTIYTPVCLVESISENSSDKGVLSPQYIAVLNQKNIKQGLFDSFASKTNKWIKSSDEDIKKISLYFATEINDKITGKDQHSERIRQMIKKIADINSVKVVRNQ